jgi:hypothetical protein
LILTPAELAIYDAYHQCIQDAIVRGDTAPVKMTSAEAAILDKVAHDTQAAALNKQYFVLIRVEKLPQ